jgi:hypothetical protein
VKIPYLAVRAKSPLPSLGGSYIRPRPVVAVRLTGPQSSVLLDGLLDTGSDETVFEDWTATAIGLDLTQAEERRVGLVGRTKLLRCRYASVTLRITDGIRETYEWSAVVGFVQTRLRYPLLGHAGFLQFFNSAFQGADRQVVVIPNRSFPDRGRRAP